MKRIFLFFSLVFSFTSLGQELLFVERDTLKFSDRVGGEIDSMDMSYANRVSTFSGGALNTQNTAISPSYIFERPGLINFRTAINFQAMRFSALPHLGFWYSFGAKATQFLHFDYEQSFKSKTLLNISGQRNSLGSGTGTAGFLRNGKYKDNLLTVQLRRNAPVYSYYFKGGFQARETNLNGGITDDSYNDTIIQTQGLDFVPVKLSNAKSNIQLANVQLAHYFNLLNDSLHAIGFTLRHHYEVTQRVFTSIDSVKNWNISSDSTRDQYRFASLRNSGGIYLKYSAFFVDFLLQHRYWDYQNLGTHRDTTEINFISSLRFERKKMVLRDEFYFNIIGSGREWSNKTSLLLDFGQLSFNGNVNMEQKWPEAFQRFYTANQYAYQLSDYKLQSRLLINGIVNYKANKWSAFGELQSLTLHNNYFFIDSIWRNDTINTLVLNSLAIGGRLQLGIFHLHPKVTVSVPTANFSYLPATAVNSRFFIKKRMFKSKKMEGILGVDVNWVSSYKLLAYNSEMDLFALPNGSTIFQAQTNLSAFFGFAIEEFRFYARMENISYLWNYQPNQVLQGFPIQKNFLRLGITWDFFN